MKLAPKCDCYLLSTYLYIVHIIQYFIHINKPNSSLKLPLKMLARIQLIKSCDLILKKTQIMYKKAYKACQMVAKREQRGFEKNGLSYQLYIFGGHIF